ncbi:MAG: hypothetical protein AAB381_02380 [Patescibacteria group bacterium]
MENVLIKLTEFSNQIAGNYNLDLEVFFVIYLTSFIPFYLGYFLMIFGSTRKLRLKDIFSLNIRNKLRWNDQSSLGLLIHLFGRIMPYAYIVWFGRNLPILMQVLVWGSIVLSIFFAVRKFFVGKSRPPLDIEIVKKEIIDDPKDKEKLWEIYNSNFEHVNKISPCKQSFDHEHFIETLTNHSVKKYLILKKGGGFLGIGFITSDFKNTPWISEDYFKTNFQFEYQNNLMFYFMGLAISSEFQGRKYSIPLLEYIIDDLPHGAVMGFDHSRNINPLLHHFTRVVRQAKIMKRMYLDRQHYHVVTRKNSHDL